MDKQKEFTYANNENFIFGRNTDNYIGYVGSPISNTLVFNPEDVDQSAILLIGTNQIDLRRFDFSAITDIEINHVRYIREDMIDKRGKIND
jgi:hypothetical protein